MKIVCPHRAFLWLLLALIVCSSGCVRRRMTVRSNPPGALVFIDDQQIGITPVSTNFTYYGTRKITLVKDGFETLTVKQDFDAPWYQIIGVDFFTENLVPSEFRDERLLEFALVPQRLVPAEEVLRNAENMRRSTQQGFVVPLPAAEGFPPPPVPSGPLAPPLVAPAAAEVPRRTALRDANLPEGAAPYRGPWQ